MASQDRNTPYNAECVLPAEVEQALGSAQLPPIQLPPIQLPPILSPSSGRGTLILSSGSSAIAMFCVSFVVAIAGVACCSC
ncbi:hypothetical protein L211DRAFT_839873 [Terfezia boudieri ATCC MYA-4762]|uniref:Uncharacterized protein n=1 Tax=Terfezia boudieri ATCC MYA-4762 TaxID=1051890 RepID=A0A3N4LL96_9PEZI|nr:hypothetical protein L211DRAFT_839873 [Terfezia boudieri ATCC MYA-4762]